MNPSLKEGACPCLRSVLADDPLRDFGRHDKRLGPDIEGRVGLTRERNIVALIQNGSKMLGDLPNDSGRKDRLVRTDTRLRRDMLAGERQELSHDLATSDEAQHGAGAVASDTSISIYNAAPKVSIHRKVVWCLRACAFSLPNSKRREICAKSFACDRKSDASIGVRTLRDLRYGVFASQERPKMFEMPSVNIRQYKRKCWHSPCPMNDAAIGHHESRPVSALGVISLERKRIIRDTLLSHGARSDDASTARQTMNGDVADAEMPSDSIGALSSTVTSDGFYNLFGGKLLHHASDVMRIRKMLQGFSAFGGTPIPPRPEGRGIPERKW